MNFPVTRFAQRNDIEPMFPFVSKMMVALLSLLAAIGAFQGSHKRQFPCLNGATDGVLCLNSQRVFDPIFYAVFAVNLFAVWSTAIFSGAFAVSFSTFCATPIFATSLFATFGVPVLVVVVMKMFFRFFCLPVCSDRNIETGLAATTQILAVFVKLGKGKNSLAFRAGLCLNGLRHIVSFSNSMLRPAALTERAVGLFYCIKSNGASKPQF